MTGLYRIVALDAELDRREFSCGVDALDRYFRERVTQDMRRRVTSCFVAIDGGERVAGFYTLAAASVVLGDLPHSVASKLPRYPTVPAVRMGRLAVDRRRQGTGLGGALVADALARTLQSEIAAVALVVDAKDEHAVAFYRHHGFIGLENASRTLFLPLATAGALLR